MNATKQYECEVCATILHSYQAAINCCPRGAHTVYVCAMCHAAHATPQDGAGCCRDEA